MSDIPRPDDLDAIVEAKTGKKPSTLTDKVNDAIESYVGSRVKNNKYCCVIEMKYTYGNGHITYFKPGDTVDLLYVLEKSSEYCTQNFAIVENDQKTHSRILLDAFFACFEAINIGAV